jgi:hypothetical protein
MGDIIADDSAAAVAIDWPIWEQSIRVRSWLETLAQMTTSRTVSCPLLLLLL